jgi:hypothetical protein
MTELHYFVRLGWPRGVHGNKRRHGNISGNKRRPTVTNNGNKRRQLRVIFGERKGS